MLENEAEGTKPTKEPLERIVVRAGTPLPALIEPLLKARPFIQNGLPGPRLLRPWAPPLPTLGVHSLLKLLTGFLPLV